MRRTTLDFCLDGHRSWRAAQRAKRTEVSPTRASRICARTCPKPTRDTSIVAIPLSSATRFPNRSSSATCTHEPKQRPSIKLCRKASFHQPKDRPSISRNSVLLAETPPIYHSYHKSAVVRHQVPKSVQQGHLHQRAHLPFSCRPYIMSCCKGSAGVLQSASFGWRPSIIRNQNRLQVRQMLLDGRDSGVVRHQVSEPVQKCHLHPQIFIQEREHLY